MRHKTMNLDLCCQLILGKTEEISGKGASLISANSDLEKFRLDNYGVSYKQFVPYNERVLKEFIQYSEECMCDFAFSIKQVVIRSAFVTNRLEIRYE